ncbi:MAG: Rne/Rng family ribonuclease [Myxococcales bacterium]|nr:Rne/Rng family ribonuclease [Myxococcales bacterium]
MSKENLLVVNADGPETRVARLSGGTLAEIYIERRRERGLVGNIYKGRVAKVLPGMQCAFIDLGVEKGAFLHVADVRGGGDFKAFDSDSDSDDNDSPKRASKQHQKIEQLLKEGNEIVVQVTKDPMGTKGARVTTYVSLAGRHLVFMPTVDHLGVSRRIGTDKERKRLRDLLEANRPAGAGFIARTVAEGAAEQELKDDIDFLTRLWREILRKMEKAKPASLVYADLDLLLRLVRDELTEDVARIIIDSKSELERVQKFVAAFMPQFQGRLQHYEGIDPIFDAHGIEADLAGATDRKVWLKSGGYLIVEQGEALTAIDVNTGRFVGKKDQEETITKNNLEACKEVAAQLRLRNIGGIIVVDFIDMDKESNRDKVWKAFNEALKEDRTRANVTKISELGLVEMTRKRTRESLSRLLTEPCDACEGKGYNKSRITVAYEILRKLRRVGNTVQDETVVVWCHPEVATVLDKTDRAFVDDIEKRLQKRIEIRGRAGLHVEKFEIQGQQGTGPGKGSASAATASDLAKAPVKESGASAGGGAGAAKGERRRGRRGGGRDKKGTSGGASAEGSKGEE